MTRQPLNRIYGDKFFSHRSKSSVRVPYVVKGMMEIWKPETFMDAGCAIGDVVKGMLDAGVDAYGIEGSDAVKPYIIAPADRIHILDLGEPVDMERRYDLVYSIEVAEHIEPECAETFIDNLCAFSDNIIMSAAPPGQGGVHHVNCQPKEYWVERFDKRGYQRRKELEESFKDYIKPIQRNKVINIIFNHNLMVFEK